MEEEQGEDSEVLDAMDGWDSEEETNANSAAPGNAASSADGGAETTADTEVKNVKGD
jgi:hypothetical protein